MSAVKVSHGRGDDTPYADGEIVREGPVGDQGDGNYSSGRGGTGNIISGGQPAKGAPHDDMIIPETATRIAKEESHHVGRGGAGNESHVHKDSAEQHGFNKKAENEGLFNKVKNIFKKG